ncbi:MAG: DUF5011 domain-containing protein [Eggerthellaceae bacterium]|nr:DUF5011 domain-containing protein [Eggerthellaceae bacterium]
MDERGLRNTASKRTGQARGKRSGIKPGALRKGLAAALAVSLALTMGAPMSVFADDVPLSASADDAVVAPIGDLVDYGEDSTEGIGQNTAAGEGGDFAGGEVTAAAAQEEADEGAGGFIPIMPLGGPIADRPGGVTVDNWTELVAAVGNNTVSYIEFTGDIQRTNTTNLPAITRSLTVDGMGFKLDFRNNGANTAINSYGFSLAAAPAAGATFTVDNLVVVKTNVGTTAANQRGGHFIGASAGNGTNWTVNLNNTTAPTSGPEAPFCGIINAPQATMNVTGELDWYSGAADVTTVLVMRQYYSGPDTVVNLVGHVGLSSTTDFINYSATRNMNVFSVTDGAQVFVKTENVGTSNAINMNLDTNAASRVEFLVYDAGTSLTVHGNGRGTGNSAGLVSITAATGTGTSATSPSAKFEVKGGATAEFCNLAQNNGQPALVIQGSWTQFVADGEGTSLLFENWGESDNNGAMIRYYAGSNNAEFRASNNAELSLIRHASTSTNRAPALRVNGTDAGFYAESGATISIINEGSVSYTRNNNQGIEFNQNGWTFDVSGYHTSIELIANLGVAIGGNRNNGTISIGEDSIFVGRGWGETGTGATTNCPIDAGTNLTFEATRPLFFDLATLNPDNQASAINCGNNSRFVLTNSDLAVWGNSQSRLTAAAGNAANSSNDPNEGTPYKSWSILSSLTLTGNNFNGTFATADRPYIDNTVDNFGTQGTWPYRRVSMNNANPHINDFIPATNADKYVRAFATVPEGLDYDGRPAWDDEVIALWNITRDGNTMQSGPGQSNSVRYEDYYEVETDVGTFEGVVRYSDGELLHTGDVYEITEAWRGEEDPARRHMAQPEDITSGTVTVMDVLPPVPAELVSPNEKLWVGITSEVTGTWTEDQAAAEPHNPEAAEKLYAVVNSADNIIMDGAEPLYGTLEPGGTWTYTFTEAALASLKEGDKVYFILEDENENANPIVDTPIHDTTMLAAPYLTVSVPALALLHDDAYIGRERAAEVADMGQNSPEQFMELKGLINARAEKLTATSLGTGVSVTSVTPPWNEPSYYDRDAFTLDDWPLGEDYRVRYEADDDKSLNNTGTVTVLPFDQAAKLIGANHFEITVNNASALMARPAVERDPQLIALAEAMARDAAGEDFDAAKVEVLSVAIPADPTVGESYDVTFKVMGSGTNPDKDHKVTIKAYITDGATPVLMVTSPVLVWLGDPADMPQDGYILPDAYDPKDYVTAFFSDEAGAADITDAVTFDDSKVDLGRVGAYPVVYSVTNSDGNSTTATGVVAVGTFVADDNYLLGATSFVKLMDEADASEAAVIDDARAQAYLIDQAATNGLVPVDVMLVSAGGYAAGCAEGTYPVTLGVVAPSGGPATSLETTVDAVVTDRDRLTDKNASDTNIRYTIAASDVADLPVSEAPNYAGTSDDVQLKLINASLASAWKLMDTATPLNATDFPLATLGDAGVFVKENNIPATGGRANQACTVVFGIVGYEDIDVTVTYLLSGTPPTITFDEAPLIVAYDPSASAHDLSPAEIKAKLVAWDLEDGDLWDDVTFTVNGSATATINTGNPAVYSVTYAVTDSDGMAATEATRAIVIQDGRYMIGTDVIIGAKNFVMRQSTVQGGAPEVLSASFAEAYLIDGTAAGMPTVANFDTSGWVQEADPDVYDFDLVVDGFPDQVKAITGTVTDADYISPTTRTTLYVMTANDFTVNLSRAQELVDAGLANSLPIEAQVMVYSLVDGIPAATPQLASNGGFRAEVNADPGYPLEFGARTSSGPVSGVHVNSYGIVSQGEPPVVTALTPLEVWVGDPGMMPTNAISPSSYFDLYEVSATDFEDGDFDPSDITVTYLIPASGPDLTTPGIYTLMFSVTDSDDNVGEATRAVIVNDGTMTVGEGRVLSAKSFVTKTSDVSTVPANLEAEALAKSNARLFDGSDGSRIELGDGTLDSVNLGMPAYGPMAGDYDITITAIDALPEGASGTIDKTVLGKVVDADVLFPEISSPYGPDTYVWGTHADLPRNEAISAALAGDSGVLDALLAGSLTALPGGGVDDPGLKVVDRDGFIDIFSGPDAGNPEYLGIYYFTVSAMDGTSPIELTINVWEGPRPDIAVEKDPPVVLNYPQLRAPGNEWMTGPDGFVSYERLIEGVLVHEDRDGMPYADYEVDLSEPDNLTTAFHGPLNPPANLKIEIFDVSDGGPGTLVPGIPTASGTTGAYKVVYTYTNQDFNQVMDSRLFVREHYTGETAWSEGYLIRALSFVIRSYDVIPSREAEQISDMSESAFCWDYDGNPRPASVASTGGYAPSANDYPVIIQAVPHPATTKSITAKVVDAGDPDNQRPGDTHGDNGATCMVIGTNFRMNTVDAEELASLGASDFAAFEKMIVGTDPLSDTGLANMELWHRGDYAPANMVNRHLDDEDGFIAAAGSLVDGDSFTLTLRCGQDDAAKTTITLFVDNGLPPVIYAPEVRIIWVGDPADMPVGAIMADDWLSSNGRPYDVTADDDYPPFEGLTDFILVGTVGADGTFTESDPVTDTDPVDLGVRDVFQPFAYSVTDADYNTTTREVQALVTKNATLDGDYLIMAYSFVETVKNVDTSDAAVLDLAAANAWRLRNSSETSDPLPWPVDNLLQVTALGGYQAAEGDYDIQVGIEPEPGFYGGMNPIGVVGRVVDLDEIARDFVGDAHIRYTVAANHVAISYNDAVEFCVGAGDPVVDAYLIDRALAQAWEIDGAIGPWDVEVVSSEIGASGPVETNTEYEVVFAPKGYPGIFVTVIFRTDEGNPPVITFDPVDGYPLVFPRTAASNILSLDDLRLHMTVTDVEDDMANIDLLAMTEVSDADGNPLMIDTSSVGVYQAYYYVEDSDGNPASAARAIIVDDGRYTVDTMDGTIIGARDYVIRSADVDGTEAQAMALSYAEAFDISGEPLDVAWTGAPAGYVAAAPVGDYDITWEVPGRMATKDIVAHVIDADVIDMGDKDASYALVANHFRANLMEAQDILDNAMQSYIDWAQARVIPLVPGLPVLMPLVEDTGNFAAALGTYPITFRIDTIPADMQSATIDGLVTQGEPPVLMVDTPIEIWIGDASLPQPAGSVLPGDYTDHLFRVTATDTEDDAAGIPLVVEFTDDATTGPLDKTTVGRYVVHYSLTDSDSNTVEASRVIVVNDGRYTVGDGRILIANAFVTLLSDVAPPFSQDILNKSGAALYDGTTGEEVLPSGIFVYNDGGYSPMVGSYDIVVRAEDDPSGYLDHAITGVVIDADFLDFGPGDPDKDNYYAYGNDITLRIGEAEAILAAADPTAALLDALGAGALKTTPIGRVEVLDPTLADDGGFMAVQGFYTVVVTAEDPDEMARVELTIQVTNGAPPTITADPMPLEVAADLMSTEAATRDMLMKGVKATDDEDGDITDWVVINPDADGAEVLPMIPLNAASVTPITYYVMDSDGNSDEVTRAFIVNDGSIVFDDDYVIQASSFIIQSADVMANSPAEAMSQIMDLSKAQAWKVDGTPATAFVLADGGYCADPADYHPTIGIQEWAALTKDITARVLPEGVAAGNGDVYSITASDFRINIADALALQEMAADPDYNPEFLSRASTTSFLRTGSVLEYGGTPVLVSDGGFATADFAREGEPGYPTIVPITFWVDEDHTATVTINAIVSQGNHPEISLPPMRVIWTGAAADQPAGSFLPEEWDYVWGPTYTSDDSVMADDFEDGDLTDLLLWGAYDASGGFVEMADPLDLSRVGFQTVVYSVTDSDGNTTEKAAKVLINDGRFVIDGDYAVEALDFVMLARDVTGTDDEILAAAKAHAWRIAANDPADEALLPIAVDNLLAVKDNAGYSATPGAYAPIQIGISGPEPGYSGDPVREVTGIVIDGDVIGDDMDGDTRYIVVASHARITIAEAPDYVGLSDEAKALLIERAAAVSFEIAAALADWDVDVLENEIGDADHPIARDAEYLVTFIPAGQPDIRATVTFTIDNGNDPVIEFTQAPLVLEQTPESYLLTDADLKAFMTVMDVEDGDLWDETTVEVAGGAQLDQHKIGVWQVTYTVTDSDNNTVSASRAVVITDGRFTIDDMDDIIIGARDYVIASADVDGTEAQAMALSYVEAYDISGEPLDVTWTGAPAGYVAGAEADDYPITWTVPGRDTTKDITAYVLDADVIDAGGKDSSYALVANHFRANLREAAEILAGAPQSYIDWARARVIPLVPGLPVLLPLVEDTGNFDAVADTYPVTFSIDTIPADMQSATIDGLVTQGEMPVLTVKTPVEIWVGDASLPQPAGSILPSAYTDDLYAVTATDVEDGDLIDFVVVTPDAATGPVDTGTVGRYVVHYSVTDSDDNTVEGSRVVVVNDGRYTVGDGRILMANSFVTLVKDVAAPYDQDILAKSNAALYEGDTGEAASVAPFVASDGGYGPVAGSYGITVRGNDDPSGTLDRAITGVVVDAAFIDSGPNDPDKDNYYVFGNDITLRTGEAEAILAEADPTVALLEALGAGALKTTPTSMVEVLAPTLADDGGFMAAQGTYTVVVTAEDPDEMARVELTVQVTDGAAPTITATPTPLEVAADPASTDVATRDMLMEGVVADDDEDGDITDWVVVNPDADGAEVLPTIPLNAASVTPVTYFVTDSDGNTAQVTRAFIVNDGSIAYDDNYVIQASSFIIQSADVVAGTTAQIMDLSKAQAWKADGTPATAFVLADGGYSAVPTDYHPTIGIQEWAALTKDITARVLPEGVAAGNGELYSITASDFRINIADALALQAKDMPAYGDEFVARSGAASFLRTGSNLASDGTPALTDDGGFKTADFAREGEPGYPTVVPVTFWVDEDHTATVTVNAIVSQGNHPEISLPPMRVIWTGDAADKPAGAVLPAEWDYVYGPGNTPAVTATDVEDGDLTALLVWGVPDASGDFVEKADPIDMGRIGFHTIAYSVTDSDGNTAVKTDRVLVNDGRFVIDGDYAVEAQDFTILARDVTGTDAEVLEAAQAHAWRIAANDPAEEALLPIAVDHLLVVKDNAGYSSAPKAYTPIQIGISAAEPGYSGDPVRDITGTVVGTAPPTLTVTTPVEVAIGSTWDEAAAMDGVTATDEGGRDLIDQVTYAPTDPARPVDTSKAGIYQLTYEVSDVNGTATAQRSVIVNDGRYIVGAGRIIQANSFMIRTVDVPASAAAIPAHLLSMTNARLFDGETGEELPASLLSVADTGGYTNVVDSYDISISAPDLPSGTVTELVKGIVVEADALASAPLDPDDPFGPRMYVFGQNVTMKVSEAALIVALRPMDAGTMSLLENDRLISDDALIEAILGGATLVHPGTGETLKDVKIVDDGGFAAEPGNYVVKISDAEGYVEITLNVEVVEGEPPTITPQRPVVVPVSSTPGNLTDAQRIGTSTAYDAEDGDLTSQITVEGDVPGDVPGIYKVALRVVDSDGNEAIEYTAVVVDDGSFVFGEDYILSAYDFTIAAADVDTAGLSAAAVEGQMALMSAEDQIILHSMAVAASFDGTPASVMVADQGGYTNAAGEYHPVIAVVEEPATTKEITATVTEPEPEEYDRFAVNFDPNGGTLTGPAVIYVQEPATTLSYLPSSPVREGYTFVHWATTPEGGTEFTVDTPVLSDMTVYAQWTKLPDPPAPEPTPPTPPTPTPVEQPKAGPKTGDDTNAWSLLLLMAASATALGAGALYRRRSLKADKEDC